MKSLKSFFKFPFVIIRREKYQELIYIEENSENLRTEISGFEKSCLNWKEIAMDLDEQLSNINLKRNAKGQFERRDNV